MRQILDADLGIAACALAHQRPVHRDLAELVDQQGQAARLAPLDQVAQQGGLSGAEKAGDDRDGNALVHAATVKRDN
jgi:hypothetical protein